MEKFIINFFKSLFSARFKSFIKKYRRFNAINKLDQKMLSYINYRNGFYIECGANDGINQSNTWYFEKYLNWRGVLVEPNYNVFEQLKKNRSKKNIFINKALVSSSYKKKKISLVSNNLYSKINLSHYSKKNIIHAPAITLDKIFQEKKIRKDVDFFSLDVEGYEMHVLNGINFKKYIIRNLLIETNNFSRICLFLKKNNYRFVKKMGPNDYLFSRLT